jgi:hypothetical protein
VAKRLNAQMPMAWLWTFLGKLTLRESQKALRAFRESLLCAAHLIDLTI